MENSGIDFKKPEISDRKWIKPLLARANLRGSHQNFTTIFAWSEIYQSRVAEINAYLVVKGVFKDNPVYSYPVGFGDIKPVFEVLRRDAAFCGHKLTLFGLSPENVAVVRSLYPGDFEFQAKPESFDYVYRLDKLVDLSGKKLQSKRNHINTFKRKHQDWRFEEITPENLAECREMNKRWTEFNTQNDGAVIEEARAVRRCFKYCRFYNP